jgi:hypothetical protein
MWRGDQSNLRGPLTRPRFTAVKRRSRDV